MITPRQVQVIHNGHHILSISKQSQRRSPRLRTSHRYSLHSKTGSELRSSLVDKAREKTLRGHNRLLSSIPYRNRPQLSRQEDLYLSLFPP
jgi:hypothetical protein